MNRIVLVEDLDSGMLCKQSYDLAIFASGHEARANHIAGLVDSRNVGSVGVFGFDSSVEEGARRINDAFFREIWQADPIILSTRAENEIYSFLTAQLRHGENCRVLVDYSSMTRFWYAAILNWFRFCETHGQFDVDFAYCAGMYSGDIPTLQIDDILSIPGCEGNTAAPGPSVALFGLGFDNNSVQCVLDDLEPDVVKTFIAGGAARAEYIRKVKAANGELLQRCGGTIELPLESVATTLTCLGEVVTAYDGGFNVSIIPLGPKPHVLASILLAMKFPQVAALHVSGRRSPAWNALPTERVVGTRVRFRSSPAGVDSDIPPAMAGISP